MLTDVTHVELEEDEVVSSNAGGEDALYQVRVVVMPMSSIIKSGCLL